MECTLTPRAYQTEAVDNCFELFDEGTRGALIRSFTGSGKTPMACMAMEKWINRSTNHKCMVISYEKQLVWQFAQEVEDFLSVTPGVEMGGQRIDMFDVPDIVVVSRQSLLKRKSVTEQQRQRFEDAGIGPELYCKVSSSRADGLLNLIDEGHFDSVLSELESVLVPLGPDRSLSRLYKFNHENDWLVIYDEAHKHAAHLKSIRHIVEWFDLNPESRRLGLTATPRRSDKVSIGHKMFPGIALDYPMYSPSGKSAIKDGYSVPLIQRYISVENVDFTKVEKLGKDFKPEELDKVLNTEKNLASMCGPLLDLVGNRRTLIFSPTVKMAEEVADYLNARRESRCFSCHSLSWQPRHLIGDGAQCKCGELLDSTSIVDDSPKARCISGTTPVAERAETYRLHQASGFQFLSVCGLCKEGYNDPDIACVAIFRPVSQDAVSLAEQMKGRGARPLRGLIEGIDDADERVETIRASGKPDCLIVDLVGVSGLQDCASTVQIYAEGEPDEVIQLAEKLLLDGDEQDVGLAVEKAKEEIEQEKEAKRKFIAAAKQEAEERAARRAKADAQVEYSVHETGSWDRPQGTTMPNGASEKQLQYIYTLGLDLAGYPITKKQAGRIITQLKEGETIDNVRYTNSLPKEIGVAKVPATLKQLKFLNWKNIPLWDGITRKEASDLIDRYKNPEKYAVKEQEPYRPAMQSTDYWHLVESVSCAASSDELTAIAKIAKSQQSKMDSHQWDSILEVGKRRRQELCETRTDLTDS